MSMLNDRERFILAKKNFDLEQLIQLISSNDPVTRISMIQRRISSQNLKISTNGRNESGHLVNETSSDLNQEWMGNENRVSHCALNQITYIMLQMKKEIELFLFYNSPLYDEKILEYSNCRKNILKNFIDTNSIQKRIQKYMLMADESGIQAAFYLLLVLSDDELSLQPQQQIIQLPNQNKKNLGNSFLESMVEAIKFNPSLKGSSRVNKQQHAQKQSWFFKKINMLIDLINQTLNDSNCKKNCKRVVLLFLSNLFHICNKQTKLYTQKKSTMSLLEQFFTSNQDLGDDELQELEQALLIIYTQKEVVNLLSRTKYYRKNSHEFFKMFQRRITFDVGTSNDGQVQYEIESNQNFKNMFDQFQNMKDGSSNQSNLVSSQLIRTQKKMFNIAANNSQIPTKKLSSTQNLLSDISSQSPDSQKNQIIRKDYSPYLELKVSDVESELQMIQSEDNDQISVQRIDHKLIAHKNLYLLTESSSPPPSEKQHFGIKGVLSSYQSGQSLTSVSKKKEDSPSYDMKTNHSVDASFLEIKETYYVDNEKNMMRLRKQSELDAYCSPKTTALTNFVQNNIKENSPYSLEDNKAHIETKLRYDQLSLTNSLLLSVQEHQDKERLSLSQKKSPSSDIANLDQVYTNEHTSCCSLIYKPALKKNQDFTSKAISSIQKPLKQAHHVSINSDQKGDSLYSSEDSKSNNNKRVSSCLIF